jgi:ribonuclease-3
MFQLFLKDTNKALNIDKSRRKKLKELSNKIGVKFKNLKLLNQALTHTSCVEKKSKIESYERLEFLGDAILNTCVAIILYELCPDYKEGSLSSLRASIIDGKTLSEVAFNLRLLDYINLGKGETLADSRAKEKVSADLVEAIIGAIYLEFGFEKAFNFVKNLLDSEIKKRIKIGPKDFKTQLQKLTVARFKEYPKYEVIKEEGPEHNKIFEVSVSVNGNQYFATAVGRTKKDAEQRAAEKVLQMIRGSDNTKEE